MLQNDDWEVRIFGDNALKIAPFSEWFEELRDCFLNPDGYEDEPDLAEHPQDIENNENEEEDDAEDEDEEST